MALSNALRIAVMPGYGIGEEVTSPCLELIGLARKKVGGIAFHYDWIEAGAGLYSRPGSALPDEAVKRARERMRSC